MSKDQYRVNSNVSFYSDGNGFLCYDGINDPYTRIFNGVLTAPRTYTLPDLSGTIVLANSLGQSGQVLTSQGAGSIPQWSTPGGGLPYTEWYAQISQTGANAPTIDSVLYNSAGITIGTITRSAPGNYSFTLSAGTLRSKNKCFMSVQLTGYNAGFNSSLYGAVGIGFSDATHFAISTTSMVDISTGGIGSDGVMSGAYVRIIVF